MKIRFLADADLSHDVVKGGKRWSGNGTRDPVVAGLEFAPSLLGTKPLIPDSEFRIPEVVSGISNSEFDSPPFAPGTSNAETRNPRTASGIRNSESGIPPADSRVPFSVSPVPSPVSLAPRFSQSGDSSTRAPIHRARRAGRIPAKKTGRHPQRGMMSAAMTAASA